MSKPTICAFGNNNEGNTYWSGYAAETMNELFTLISEDGGCPTDFEFFEVGKHLKLQLVEA